MRLRIKGNFSPRKALNVVYLYYYKRFTGGLNMALNKVIAGEYAGKNMLISRSTLFGEEEVNIFTGFTKKFPLNKKNVANYELITEEHRKSAVSGVSRGLVGGALLGPVGLLAGISAKSKGSYTIALEFKDSKKSLIEIDEKMYKLLIKTLF